jgi:hypothetical protein
MTPNNFNSVNIISSSDNLFPDGSSQNKTRPNNKGKNNIISYEELDQKLDNLDIKHRKIANEPVIAQPIKSNSDKVDRILDNIPQNITSKDGFEIYLIYIAIKFIQHIFLQTI